MKHASARGSWTGAAALAVALSLAGHCAAAAPVDHPIPSRIVAPIDVSDRVTLAGNTHPFVKHATDQGLVSGEQKLGSMFIVLRRSPSQERALAKFNARQLDAASPDYHHWLQPREFGLSYGPNEADISAVANWLTGAGLQIHKVSDGRVAIEFSGTAAQVQQAFGVEMHRYLAQGTAAIANDRDPTIPRAVTPVVAGVAGLDTFAAAAGAAVPRTSTPHAGNASGRAAVIGPQPDLSVRNDSENFAFMTPFDFATVYNSLPLWNASKPIIGSGVTIAVVTENDVKADDVATFRSTLGLPASAFTVKHVGSDPGGSSKTGTVGLEMAGAAAPGASLELVVPETSNTVASIIGAIAYTVDNNLAPIVTFGFFTCELGLGTTNNAMVNSLWQQGATQGMSILVAAGDQGSAGCNYNNGDKPDSHGLAVNGFASSPFVTAVGGTDFAWQWGQNQFSTYWNPPSTPVQYESAKSYIPEVPWNVTCTNAILLKNVAFLFLDVGQPAYPYADTQDLCNAQQASEYYTPLLKSAGGGGGYSHCTSQDANGNCVAGSGYAKPVWQRGSGVPADGKRDLPDVSIFASMGWPDYAGLYAVGEPIIPGTAVLICYTGGGDPCTYGNFNVNASSIGNQAYGGTGAAAAYWAGIVALVVQKEGGARQGLINPKLYSLSAGDNLAGCNTNAVAAGNTCIFYDVSAPVTTGMTCIAGSSADCTVLPTQIDNFTTYGILDAYTGGVGYDQTTGLGSVNITNLVNSWSTAGSSPPAPAASAATGALVDYLGDGKSDFSVWRPSSGYFYSKDEQGTTSAQQWGLSTDIPVVGDFDGDGVTDAAVWRPSTGTWYITESSTGHVVSKQWGASTDVPVVGDFDGDGKTDIAVWRPSTGFWYIVQSSNGAVVTKAWGAPTDMPVAGDFDGDGKTDIAVWRPSTGYWYIVQSSNGALVAKQWGAPTDVPVFGDFDGDGKTDVAVYRPSTGYWYVVQSTDEKVIATQWGAGGDLPVPSDYSGTGKTNIAVWRPSTGTWYVYEGSSQPALVQAWGAGSDIPLEQKAEH